MSCQRTDSSVYQIVEYLREHALLLPVKDRYVCFDADITELA